MKGLSPFIAAIMLIAFTVAVGGIISIFLTGFFKSSTGSVGSSGNALIACAGNAPTVDAVLGNKTSGVFNITYTNPGSVSLVSMAGYLTKANATTVTLTLPSSTLAALSSQSLSVAAGGVDNSTVTEVRVVGVCISSSGNSTLSGSCLTGSPCMIITS